MNPQPEIVENSAEVEVIQPEKDLVSGKPNMLIQSRLGLQNINEHRLFLAMLERAYDGADIEKAFEVDISTISPGNGGSQYTAVKAACQGIMARTIDLSPGDKKRFRLRHLVDMADFDELRGKGKLSVRFHPDMVPHIKSMFKVGHYTKIYLKYAIPLRSTYSARIYELLLQFRSFGQRTMSIEELRFFLDIQKKLPQWINIKQRILDPARRHLEEYTDIAFDYEAHRLGKVTHSIKFIIRENNPRKLPADAPRQIDLFENTPLPLPDKEAEHVRIVREYIWPDQQEQALHFSAERILYYFHLAQTAQRLGKIKSDFKGYFYSALFRDKENFEYRQKQKKKAMDRLKKEEISKQAEEREADEAFSKATRAFDALPPAEQEKYLSQTHSTMPTGIRRHTAIALFAGLT